VSRTPPLFSCKSISVKQGDGAWRADPGRTPLFSGDGPNGQALPYCGTCSSLRGAFGVLPVAELLVVDAEHQPPPNEYQEYSTKRKHLEWNSVQKIEMVRSTLRSISPTANGCSVASWTGVCG
jgi:hypothetical protein